MGEPEGSPSSDRRAEKSTDPGSQGEGSRGAGRSPISDRARAGFEGARNSRRRFAVSTESTNEGSIVNLLWIILIVVLVLALLGFFGRGRW